MYLSFLYYALNYSKNHHAIGKKAKKVAALDWIAHHQGTYPYTPIYDFSLQEKIY